MNTEKKGWRECDTCAAKPGSPYLCRGCIHNRELFGRMERPLQSYQEELVTGVKEIIDRAEADIQDAKPFGHSSYGMGVAVGERDAATEIITLIKDTKI